MEIKRSRNPLTLRDDLVYTGCALSPNQIIKQENLIFLRPVVLLKNGEPVLRKDWNIKLKDNDVCCFVELPGVEGLIAAAIFIAKVVAVVIITYGLNLLLNMWFGADPADPDDIPQVTRYNLSANRNTIQIGQPFPEHFGRFICFPPLIQRSYTEYADNIQYQYSVGVVGIGEYDIENVYIDKTPIADYSEATYNIIQPGGALTLVPDIVWVSAGILNQEITETWLTSAVSPAGTEISEIGFDIVFPAGLFRTNRKGKVRSTTVSITAECRLIDNEGAPLDAWATLYINVISLAATSVVRYSIKSSVPQGVGRYEFRIHLHVARYLSIKHCNLVNIESLRGYGAAHDTYDNITLIEFKIKATEQLNGDVNNKLNVVCTRKLYPVTATGFGVTIAASRSIVDACAHIVTSDNGGQQEDAVLDFETLKALRDDLAARPNYFDYRFTGRTIVFEACKKIARCGRAVPVMPGGLFSMVRDKLQIVPTQVYTDDDYTKGTLNLEHFYRNDASPTFIEMTYVDGDTWQAQTVDCIDGEGSYDMAARVSLDGCTSRQHAYEEGMYTYWDDKLNRTSVAFTTGLKGLVPRVGDMVYVGSRQIDWCQTGQLAHISGTKVTLSEPVDFEENAEAKMLLVGKTGGVLGSYVVTPTDSAHQVDVSLPGGDVETIHEHGLEATKFIFGVTISDILRIRILKIVPISNNEIKIEGSIIHDAAHDDPGAAPALGMPPLGLLILSDLSIQYQGKDAFDNYIFYLLWSGSADEFKIEVNEGSGYVIKEVNYTPHGYAFTSTVSDISAKVTPYVGGVPSPGDAIIVSYSLPATPTGLSYSSSLSEVGVLFDWNVVAGAEYYEFAVYINDVLEYSETIEETEYRILASDFKSMLDQESPPWNYVADVRVRTMIGSVHGEWAEVGFDLYAPVYPSVLVVSNEENDPFNFSWKDNNDGAGDPDIDGFIILSGPDCDRPGFGSLYVQVKTVAATNSDRGTALTTTINKIDCYESGHPYTLSVAAYNNEMKAIDFLLLASNIEAGFVIVVDSTGNPVIDSTGEFITN